MKKLVIVAIALMLLAGAAFAANNTATTAVNISLVAGTLDVELNGTGFTFGNVTLNGLASTAIPTAVPTVTVNDYTGSGAGWTVSYDCPTLTTDTGDVATKQLSLFYGIGAGFMELDNGETDLPKVIGRGNAAMTLTPFDALQTDITADPKVEGMGKYHIAYTAGEGAEFTIPISAQQYAGQYTSTFTATIVAGEGE